MIKLDISDGFYRVWLSVADIPSLGVALPPGPDGEQLVAFPLGASDGLGSEPAVFLRGHGDRRRHGQRHVGVQRPHRRAPSFGRPRRLDAPNVRLA